MNLKYLFSENTNTVSKVIIISTFVFAVVLLFAVESVGLRMLQEKPISPMHQKMVDSAIKMTDKHSVKSVPPGTNPFFQPMGSGEVLLPEYSESEAFSIFTRHGVTGKNWKYRVLINMIHLFGALSTFVALAAIYFTKGSSGNSKLNLWAKKTFFWTTYSMWVTGTLLFLFQESGDLGFFPVISKQDSIWLRNCVFIAFSISFLNVAFHANIFKHGSIRLLYAQHLISILAWIPMMTVLLTRLFTLNYYEYQWMYNFELLTLVSLYPLLDIVNCLVLYKTQIKRKPYDWNAHRQDNLIIFILISVTVVFFFAGHDKHYFFSTHLIPAYRLFFILWPTAVWVATRSLSAWVLRAYRA